MTFSLDFFFLGGMFKFQKKKFSNFEKKKTYPKSKSQVKTSEILKFYLFF